MNFFYVSAHPLTAAVDLEPQPPQQTYLPSNDVLSECFDQPGGTGTQTNDEFKRYLQSTDTLVGNEDLLTFWTRQKNLYPTLYSIACEILIVPASNTAVERLFSASGQAVTNVRTRLSAQKLNKLMFIKKNLFILDKIFGQTRKLNSNSLSICSTDQKGEKRSHEGSSSDDDSEIFDLTDDDDNDENL